MNKNNLLCDQVVSFLIFKKLVHLDNVGMVLSTVLVNFKSIWSKILTISFRMLISLKSMRFSSSSMWLFLSTLTALCAPVSLYTHILTSPKAPVRVSWIFQLTSSEDFSNSVIISKFSFRLTNEHRRIYFIYKLLVTLRTYILYQPYFFLVPNY